MTTLVRLKSVEPEEGFMVNMRFTDGSQRKINLESYLHGPIFEAIRNDPALFRAMTVEEGTITWPNGADIDPDVLYHDLTPAWAIDDDVDVSNSESQLL